MRIKMCLSSSLSQLRSENSWGCEENLPQKRYEQHGDQLTQTVQRRKKKDERRSGKLEQHNINCECDPIRMGLCYKLLQKKACRKLKDEKSRKKSMSRNQTREKESNSKKDLRDVEKFSD